MMERGAREALTSGAARSGPDGRSPPGRVRSAWSVSAAGDVRPQEREAERVADGRRSGLLGKSRQISLLR